MGKGKYEYQGSVHHFKKKKSNIGDILGGIAVVGVILVLMASCAG